MADEKVSVSDRIDTAELPKVAQAIIDTLKQREKSRSDLEKHWAEVDRQVAMIPEKSHKMNAKGNVDPDKVWMPEIELPLQAQTLEILTADNRRFKFPKNRNWFKARAALTDEYLARFGEAPSLFPGERGSGSRAIMNQDNGDRLAEGMVAHWHGQYDFRGNIDVIDAEAVKYSCGVGRVRSVRRKIMGHEVKIGNREQTMPVYVPRSIKNVYLDDSQHALMHEGVQLGPNIIQTRTVNLADLKASALEGGEDRKDPNGGYIFEQIKRLTADNNGNVKLVELEGDLVHETSRETIIERNVVVTAAIGEKGDKSTFGLVRYREGEGFCTYVVHKYHLEGPDDAYGTSPLIKGMPIAKIAAQAMNRIMESAQLKNGPPLGYGRDDPTFAATGGPVVEPYAQWESLEEVKVYVEIGGDPNTMFQVFAGLVQLYADVVGVNAPRLGAQTKSHTTAFAKDVELQQGAVRTIDYVNSSLEGPMTRLLDLEYKMGFRDMKARETIFIEAWNEFVTIGRKHLPDIVKFTAIGAGAPAEDALQQQNRLAAVQFALQLDAAAQQAGAPPSIDIPAMIRQVLSSGGWQDVDAIILDADAGPEGGPSLVPVEDAGAAL
jgi:hypothetical protein